jgi:ribonucleotide monophosphatase NagD (HAD superfamily)
MFKNEKIDVILDFDGTVVTHEYPRIGRSIGAENTLRQLVKNGHNLILFTMRSGKELDDAVKWFKTNEIKLYGVQTHPEQKRWTSSPKAWGDYIIDDTCAFMPLMRTFKHERYYINWERMEDELIKIGLL